MKRPSKNSVLINLARGVGHTAGKIAATAQGLAAGAVAVIHTSDDVVKLPSSPKRTSKPRSRNTSKKARKTSAKLRSTPGARKSHSAQSPKRQSAR
jgi:hypothetical protein